MDNPFGTRLSYDFYARDTLLVARELLGHLVVHYYAPGIVLAGKIVETEAYIYGDPASHCYRGKTERNKSLFGPPGHAYLYRSYGIHTCFNVVSHTPEQIAGGVLIRALEPLAGIDYMQQLRPTKNPLLLTNGPGKWTQAFALKLTNDGLDLIRSPYITILEPHLLVNNAILSSPRIGISKAKDAEWRFFIDKNPYVSQ